MSFEKTNIVNMLRKNAQRNIDSNFVQRTNHRRKIIDDLEVKKGTAPTDSSSLQSNLKRRIVTFGDGLKGIPQNFSNPQTVTTYCLGLMEMWLIHLLRRKDQKEAYRRIALHSLMQFYSSYLFFSGVMIAVDRPALWFALHVSGVGSFSRCVRS